MALSALDYLRRMRSSAVYNVALRTPLEDAPLLSSRIGHRVLIKREDQQPVFSFKLRGAYNFMARLDGESLARGVIAASAGNHAQGVALAAQHLSTSALIVVPVTTPAIKVDAIRALGAELVQAGETYDEAYAYARQLEAATGRTFVHPYDHPDVIAGQGTIGLEIDEQFSGPIDAVFVAVGGGGLISGIALALKQLRPGIKIFGVEPEDSDAMSQSLAARRRVTVDRVGLFADGVAVRTVGEETFRIAQDWVDGIIKVSNDAICGAVKDIFEDRRAILEPAGALAYAGLKQYAATRPEPETLVAIACGANLNFDRLRHIAERAAIGERSEAILAIEIPERPGSFLQLCQTLGPRSITEFNYRKAEGDRAEVFAGVQVKDDTDRAAVCRDLTAAGYPLEDLTESELAKTHLRHMVGGRSAAAENERLFTLEFPERAGALATFLGRLAGIWNISAFHYRNHGSDRGRVLVGFEVPPETAHAFEIFLREAVDSAVEVTDDPALRRYLR
jgi:threonine dehydratase